MKRSFLVLSLVLILTMVSTVAFANGEIGVKIDSKNVIFNKEIGMPFIDLNNRTLVPFRAAMESFGAEVEWDAEAGKAIAKKGDITLEVPIGELYLFKNGEKLESDTVAIIKEGRTYLPIRKAIEAFGSQVEWDGKENTVVILTEPIDARTLLMDSYAKFYKWENYDAKVAMNMTMPVPNEKGTIDQMNMLLNMDMTIFMKPIKMKASTSMIMTANGEDIDQPVMEMYYTFKDNTFKTYMGMYDLIETGKLTWTQTSLENDMFSELLNYDSKSNMELIEKSTKSVRCLGKSIDKDGRTLLKLENTTSYEAYTEIMGGYMNMLSTSTNQQDKLAADLLSSIGDMTYIIYIDEATEEMVSYEMDLGSIMGSMFGTMTEDETMPAEAIEMLKSLKMTMVMEMQNTNRAKDFEIPKEALEAPQAQELAE